MWEGGTGRAGALSRGRDSRSGQHGTVPCNLEITAQSAARRVTLAFKPFPECPDGDPAGAGPVAGAQ